MTALAIDEFQTDLGRIIVGSSVRSRAHHQEGGDKCCQQESKFHVGVTRKRKAADDTKAISAKHNKPN